MPAGLGQQSGGMSRSDTVGSFTRRKRNAIMVTGSLLIVSVLILTIGLAATTRTQNVTVGGYYPGVILGFGSFLGIIGVHLIENKRQMDLRPLYARKCKYYSSTTSLDQDVQCQAAPRVYCTLRVKSNTCYCCDLYNCGKDHPLSGPQNKDVLKKFKKSPMIWNRVELMGGYHEYTNVQSCQDVVHLYHLLWSATILNIVALFLGIITAAVLGGFKDVIPTPAPDSCETEPLPDPAPCDIRPDPSYSSYYNNAPALPPYTAYDLQASSMFPDSSGLSDDSQSGASAMWPTQVPPRYSPPYYHPDDKPPPYSP
ncbi:transmembrane protein 255A-like isoform X2 [Scleropages formosus]|uniref:transmembrane protein 255A-like isoform X2 n=1 Tax=Scleropages formosus TaxID=113540 RepID=UPI00087888D3|nr:transmembrane protein 255A-like isoform X2 [Scleropages formosus]